LPSDKAVRRRFGVKTRALAHPPQGKIVLKDRSGADNALGFNAAPGPGRWQKNRPLLIIQAKAKSKAANATA